MTDNISNGIANMVGVATMGAVAMKTIDIVSQKSGRKGKRKKKRCKF